MKTIIGYYISLWLAICGIAAQSAERRDHMKRPEKKDITNMKDYDLEKCIDVGYNECHDDFTAFMPSEEELRDIIELHGLETAFMPNERTSVNPITLAKAIHKRLS